MTSQNVNMIFLGDVKHTWNHPWEWLDHKWQCLICRASSCCAQLDWTTQGGKGTITTPPQLRYTGHNRCHQSRKRNKTHLWKPSRMSRSSAGDSSITIASVLSAVTVQASILPFLLLLVLGLRDEDVTTYNRVILFKLAERPVSMRPDVGDLARTCSFLGFAATVRCWGCGGLICPELRADWWSRSDAEDMSNRLQSLRQTVLYESVPP